MGFPSGQSHQMTDVRGTRVNGGSFPATIFRRFMSAASKGQDTGSFPSVSSFPGRVLKGQRLPFTTPTSTAGPTSSTLPGTATTQKAQTVPTTGYPGPTSTAPPPPPTTSPPPPETTTTVKRHGG